VIKELRSRNLLLSHQSDRTTLIRRATQSLHGLPPTQKEVHAYVSDPREDAFSFLVDRLLASPHFGERFGKTWLDLVRYAETNGFERDTDKPFIWRYRDYVIDAFNRDKPYDQFLLEQLAGDELPTRTTESVIATGYYRLMPWDDEPGALALQARFDVLDDILSTTSQAFMGMTIGCARCHDHVADPIPQKDYYRFLAFFSGLTDMSLDRHLRPVETNEERMEYERKVDEQSKEQALLTQTIRKIEDQFNRGFAERTKTSVFQSDLSQVRFQLFRDSFQGHPDFRALKPETEGPVESNLVDLTVASRNAAIGLVFEGTLHVQAPGEYEFVAEAKRPLKLFVGDQVVLDATYRSGSSPLQKGAVQLATCDVPFRCRQRARAENLPSSAPPRGRAARRRRAGRPCRRDCIPSSARRALRPRAPPAPPPAPDSRR
jgi:hypothetical protein